MKIFTIITFFCLTFCLITVAQFDLNVGLFPKGSFVNNSSRTNNPGSEVVYFLTPAIFATYEKTSLIAKYSYSNGWSQLRNIPIRKSLGFSLRQYIIKEIPRFKWSTRVTIFAEAEVSIHKWKYVGSEINILESFSYYGLTPLLGIDINVFKKFNMEVAYGYRFFDEYSHPDLNFAIKYLIIQR